MGCPELGFAAELNGKVICAQVKVPEDEFVHLAMTYDKRFVIFYLNGNEVARNMRTDDINLNSNALFVGRGDSGLVTNALRGETDWIAIFNTARYPATIKNDAKNSIADVLRSEGEGLVLYLPFDNDFKDVTSKEQKVGTLGEPKLVEVKK